jgi:hypothetical protein
MGPIFKAAIAAFIAILSVANLPRAAGAQAGLDAIVEKDGSVVLCIAKGGILFADRCEGAGRLRIVQPLVEGPITWRGADGTIAMEPADSPNCALSKAKWDTDKERTARSGKQIRKVDGAKVLAQIDKTFPDIADLKAEEIKAFALDLDNDGKDEIVFTASNLDRMIALYDKTEKSHRYLAVGGILAPDATRLATFYRESGEYSGPTGGLGSAKTIGVVPLAPGTGEIALLLRYNWEFIDEVTLVRFRGNGVQRIEGVGQRCQ